MICDMERPDNYGVLLLEGRTYPISAKPVFFVPAPNMTLIEERYFAYYAEQKRLLQPVVVLKPQRYNRPGRKQRRHQQRK